MAERSNLDRRELCEEQTADTALRNRVSVLLCTFNGEAYLPAFLESLTAQTHTDWQLIASDDGSRDRSAEILARFATNNGRTELREGPRRGPTPHFLSLAGDASLQSGFFAFADQDDVWHPDKLARALNALAPMRDRGPALYGGRTRITNEANQPIGLSPLFAKRPSFRNALVQSLAGGNTMVFNRAAQALFVAAAGVAPVSHDWWAYQLIAGAGGEIIYDPVPAIDYRQHGSNQVGANTGFAARWRRARLLLAGRLKTWNEINLTALRNVQHLLLAEHRLTLEAFYELRTARVQQRLKALRRAGLYRQTLPGNLGLVAAAALNKL